MNLDLQKLTLPQDFQNMSGTQKLWTHIPVRKPSRTEFFRVFDNDEFSIRTAIIELKEENETYLIEPNLYAELLDFAVPVQIATVMTRHGGLLLWPVKLPQERKNAWHDTALKAMELAKTSWICMRADMPSRCYSILKAVADIPDPIWPVGELSFKQMLELGFRDFYVDTLDHPLVDRLMGKS